MKRYVYFIVLISCLNVSNSLAQQVLGTFTGLDQFEWPNVLWYRDLGNNWDEGLIKMASNTSGISRAGYGIHMNATRQFTFWSSGLDPLLSITGGTGDSYIKGNLALGLKQAQTKLQLAGDEFITLGNYEASSGAKGIHFTGYRDVRPDYFGAAIVGIPEWICCDYPGAGFAGIKNIGLNFLVHDNIDYANSSKVALAIKSSGYVGIGFENPSEKLSVNGKIRANEIRVNAQGMPDYVFAPAYQKLSLSEIENYIRKHQHLPEIPSAAEAEKNGLELGEMNKLLLKKIEELTLHLIDQDKELKAHKQKETDQEKRLRALEEMLLKR